MRLILGTNSCRVAQQDHATEKIDGKNASHLREAYQTANGSLRAAGRNSHLIPVSERLFPGSHPVRTRLQGVPMKRVRRISLSVEHREVSVSISQIVVTSSESCPTQTPGDAAQPETCPDCGASWITVVAQAGENAGPNATNIHRALKQYGAHVHVSATGELRICRKSFEEIKECH